MKSNIVLILLILSIVVNNGSAQNVDYCSFGPDHTMCKYKDGVLGAACGEGAALIPISDDEKNNIVKTHNDLRSKVALGNEAKGKDGPQPKAANMMALVWDTELEAIAQRWVMQCLGGHEERDDRITKTFDQVAQNAAGFVGTNPTWEETIQGWYSEVERIPSSARKSWVGPPGGNYGHYTAIVWATTTKIGCAAMQVNAATGHIRRICNYGRGGNMNRQAVYIEGEPGTLCPTSDPTTVADPNTGLCVLQ